MKAEIIYHTGAGSDEYQPRPTWEWVVDQLHRMVEPQSNQTLVIIASSLLVISGGQNGIFLLGAECSHGWRNLDNPEYAGWEFDLVCGGQRADYPGEACVDLAKTIGITKHFFETGVLDPEFIWDNPP